MPLRYLFDEHLRGVLPETVVRRAEDAGYMIEVTQIGDEEALPLGTLDSDMLRWAEEHNHIIVSHDAKTLPGHLAAHLAAGRGSPGVFHRPRPSERGARGLARVSRVRQ